MNNLSLSRSSIYQYVYYPWYFITMMPWTTIGVDTAGSCSCWNGPLEWFLMWRLKKDYKRCLASNISWGSEAVLIGSILLDTHILQTILDTQINSPWLFLESRNPQNPTDGICLLAEDSLLWRRWLLWTGEHLLSKIWLGEGPGWPASDLP